MTIIYTHGFIYNIWKYCEHSFVLKIVMCKDTGSSSGTEISHYSRCVCGGGGRGRGACVCVWGGNFSDSLVGCATVASKT